MNLFKLLGVNLARSKSGTAPAAHMTWAAKSMSGSLSRTGIFLRQQIWIWPILATILLSVVAFAVRSAIESTMRANLQSQLQTLLNVEVGMLEKWIQVQISNATTLANNQSVREPIYKLLENAEPGDKPLTAMEVSELQSQLRRQFNPAMSAHEYNAFVVFNKSQLVIAASQTELVGRQNLPEYEVFVAKALKGEATVCPPFPSRTAIKDENGEVRTSVVWGGRFPRRSKTPS